MQTMYQGRVARIPFLARSFARNAVKYLLVSAQLLDRNGVGVNLAAKLMRLGGTVSLRSHAIAFVFRGRRTSIYFDELLVLSSGE